MTPTLLLIATGATYAWGFARVLRLQRGFPPYSACAFAAGIAVIAGDLSRPMDARADVSLGWHMVQHLILIAVAAPLLLFGSPIRLALGALPTRLATSLARLLNGPALRVLNHPLLGLAALALVLYGTHFSRLYESALENVALHSAEHATYLFAGLLFWSPIFAIAPAPHAASHPVRILTLFLSLPASAFLGLALYVNRNVMYAHYAGRPGALEDQMNAGAIMWLSAGAPVLLALLWCVADWGARERRLGVAFDVSHEGG